MSAMDFGDPQQVIHIPARDLTGTREAKLADLDVFLAQLQAVRLALHAPTVRHEGVNGTAGPPPRPRHRAWSWPATRLRAVLQVRAIGAARSSRDRR